jgi:DNA-binding NarL/FixJ family response regulator
MAATRIIIVDDHSMFRNALRGALSSFMPGITFVEAGALEALQAFLEDGNDTELVLLDLHMPNVSGLTGLLQIRAQYPEIPVVIVSGADDNTTIRRCLDYGASGFVSKSSPVEDIGAAIEAVRRGDVWTPRSFDPAMPGDPADRDLAGKITSLTPQQIRVLRMLGEGLLNKQIAFKLNVSEATIKAHVSAILQKLKVDSRTQAVIAIQKGDLLLKPKPMP